MTITFADGTRIDVAASALDDFLRHDLKWVEFVHGRASTGNSCRYQLGAALQPKTNVAHPRTVGGC